MGILNDKFRSAWLVELTKYKKGSPMYKFLIRCYVNILKLDNKPYDFTSLVVFNMEVQRDLFELKIHYNKPIPLFGLPYIIDK